MIHLMCSDACFNRFRATKGLKTSCCDACGTYINTFTSRPEYLLHEGQQRRFCNSSCLRLYKMVGEGMYYRHISTWKWYGVDLNGCCVLSFWFQKNTKVLSCQWCRTLCKIFDMLSKVDQYGKTKHFCSLCCIASHKVKTSGDTGTFYSPWLVYTIWMVWCLTELVFIITNLLFQFPVKLAVSAKEAPLNRTTVKQMRPFTSSVALAVGANFRLVKSIPLIEFG